MTINRVQNIEKSIQELREVLDIRLTPVLMREASTAGADALKDSNPNRTYLESSLGNVEAAVDRVRSLIARIVI